jgi:protein required for attachment to host cells
MKPTWILFADASNARLYQSQAPAHDLSLLRELSHPESRAKEMDLVSDQPGRVRQSRSSARPALEYTPHRKVEADRFARQLADVLERGLDEGAYDRLILVAAPESLGRLRRQLSERVSARIVAEVEKDYLHLEPRELRERLREQLEAPRSPGSGLS